MKLQVWQSFSCNNSSSYYLVARFQSPSNAEGARIELTEFFKTHAAEVDEKEDVSYDDPSEAAKAFGAKHGFEWKGYLGWGDEALSWWLPTVEVVGDSLMISHRYCGGFGESVPEYLRRAGGETDEQSRSNPEMSIMFRIPDSSEGKAAAEAVWTFAQALEQRRIEEGDEDSADWTFADTEPPAPWGTDPTESMEFKCGAPYPCFNDGNWIGLILEISEPQEWGSIPAYFEKNGISDYHITLDQIDKRDAYRTIASATCPECKSGTMHLLPAHTHEVPNDQLACRDCGGMFDLGDLVAALQ